MRRHYPNLKLWLLLASVPFIVVGAIYLYGSANLDSSIIKEDDLDVDNTVQIENVQLEERQNDMITLVNQKMILPETKAAPVQTTTKQDKRMLDESGNMITVEVQDGDTMESLAKKHLGDEAFWVYFFEVNRDKLNKVEDFAVGMKLYVPNPEFFGFSKEDQSSIQYAKHKAEEILKSNQ